MIIKISSLLLILLTKVYCQQNPFISFISKEQYSDIGGKAEIRCTVEFNFEYPVQFMRKPDVFISSGETKIVPEDRFQISREGNTFVLTITDIQETDSNTYVCKVVKSSEEELSAETFLGIRRPPVITDDSSRDLVVIEGRNATLKCYANGYPEPNISWRRLGNEPLQSGSSIFNGNELTLTKVEKKDRGTYVCVAENAMLQGDRRNVAVYVEFAPDVTALLPNVGQAFLYDVELECKVYASPQAAISWIFNGQTINDDMHYSVTNYLGTDDKITTKLRLHSIEQKQYGKYICKATNRLGMGFAEVTLYEMYVPNPHFSGDFSPIKG